MADALTDRRSGSTDPADYVLDLNAAPKKIIAVDGAPYPDNNPKTVLGMAKPAVHAIPPVAILYLGQAMVDGMRKYGLMNWRTKLVTTSIYYDAAMRHMMAYWDGEKVAADSKIHHLAHAMACLAIILDAEEQGTLNDDRPKVHGTTARFIADNTKELR